MRFAIGELLKNSDLYLNIRKNQSEVNFDRWSIAEMNSRILKVYKECLSKI
jgi:hypothetical protein